MRGAVLHVTHRCVTGGEDAMHDERDTESVQPARRRILIAASDHRVRDALRAVLEADGRHVVVGEACTAPGLSALDQALQPELVLLDVLFPTAADGLDVIRQLARGNQRPVVALSARAGLRAAALGVGAAAFVEQGVGADELLGVVHAVMGRGAPSGS
jgi:DNA-binding NarL/FixJ family response regulator